MESVTLCHDAPEVLVGFEPRPPDCSGCRVGGLQHGATTPSDDLACTHGNMYNILSLSTIIVALHLLQKQKNILFQIKDN